MNLNREEWVYLYQCPVIDCGRVASESYTKGGDAPAVDFALPKPDTCAHNCYALHPPLPDEK